MAVTITGLEDIKKRFDEVLGKERVMSNMEQACAIVERSAKENAPKGTGELRRSITSRVEDRGGDITGVVYTPLEYAPYVEYGTGLFAEGEGRSDVPWCYFNEATQQWVSTYGQKPQPFLRPALEDNRIKIIMKLREGLRG